MKILWVDDEIATLEPFLIYLKDNGYQVDGVDNPFRALEYLRTGRYDLVFVDYKMPDIDGVEFVRELREFAPSLPVVMVTVVSDKETIEEAIGEGVVDYIIKPLNASQLLVVLKKIQRGLIYKNKLMKQLPGLYRVFETPASTFRDWLEKGEKILKFMAEVEDIKDQNMLDLIYDEIKSLNKAFFNWVRENYKKLIQSADVLMSHRVFKNEILPSLKRSKVVWIVFDNFRYDQFFNLEKKVPSGFKVVRKSYFSLLPTATPFARNALFSSKLPRDFSKRFSDAIYHNRYEETLLKEALLREKMDIDFNFFKLGSITQLKEFPLPTKRFVVYVINFLDLVSHLRSEIDVLGDFLPDTQSYIRWTQFILDDLEFWKKVEYMVENGYEIFITTDHGWIEGKEAAIVDASSHFSTGLRFKFGDSIKVIDKQKVLLIDKPEVYGLPKMKYARFYAIASEYCFFVFPSKIREFEKKYRGCITHGGITLEEMVVPLWKIYS